MSHRRRAGGEPAVAAGAQAHPPLPLKSLPGRASHCRRPDRGGRGRETGGPGRGTRWAGPANHPDTAAVRGCCRSLYSPQDLPEKNHVCIHLRSRFS